MNVISREELKEKLDRGDSFKLVMTLGEWAFQMKHIPGSLNLNRMEDAAKIIAPDDEVVVYCASETCIASRSAYQILEQNGYKNIRRYSGGLEDWEAAGYPLEGEEV
jgi:rhodanese-related sulfurtransferase